MGWLVAYVQSDDAKDSNGSFCDMRAARERTFDRGTERCGVQTSSTEALKTGF